MTDETYNGWTNRETWAVALHLDNTETMMMMAQAAYGIGVINARRAADNLGDATLSENLVNSYAGEALRDMVEQWFADLDDDSSPLARSSILGQTNSFREDVKRMRSVVGSMWRVEWSEVAAHYAPEGVAENA